MEEFNGIKFYTEKEVIKMINLDSYELFLGHLDYYIHFNGLLTAHLALQTDYEGFVLDYINKKDPRFRNDVKWNFDISMYDFRKGSKVLNIQGFLQNDSYSFNGKTRTNPFCHCCICFSQTEHSKIVNLKNKNINSLMVFPVSSDELIKCIDSVEIKFLSKIERIKNPGYNGENSYYNIADSGKFYDIKDFEMNLHQTLLHYSNKRITVDYYKEDDILERADYFGLNIDFSCIDKPVLNKKIENIIIDQPERNTSKGINDKKCDFSNMVIQHITKKRKKHNVRFLLFAFIDFFECNPNDKTIPNFEDFYTFLLKRCASGNITYIHDITPHKILLVEGDNIKIKPFRKAYNKLKLEIINLSSPLTTH